MYPGMTTRTSSGDAYTDLMLWDDGDGGMVQVLYGTAPGDGMFSLFAGDKDVVQFEEMCAG